MEVVGDKNQRSKNPKRQRKNKRPKEEKLKGLAAGGRGATASPALIFAFWSLSFLCFLGSLPSGFSRNPITGNAP
jgi:hypothetical protein